MDDVRVVAVIAAGGMLGAAARYGVSVWLPAPASAFPWWTLVVNASGCVLIGVLMVLIVEVWSPHRFVRPFLGVGILGGYTTFSTYAVDAHGLFEAGRPGLALGYLAGTPLLAVLAVVAGANTTRVVALRRPTGGRGGPSRRSGGAR